MSELLNPIHYSATVLAELVMDGWLDSVTLDCVETREEAWNLAHDTLLGLIPEDADTLFTSYEDLLADAATRFVHAWVEWSCMNNENNPLTFGIEKDDEEPNAVSTYP